MRRLGKKWWTLVAGSVVFLASAGALAFYVPTPGVAAAVVASPGPGPFNAFLIINPNPVAAGGFGDVILGIEEGRDDISHFATIAVWVAPANPANALLAGLPPPVMVPPGPAGATAYGPPPGGGFVLCQFVYRASNDPLNPGWAALPGGAGQTADDVAACHAVAEQLTAFRTSFAAGIGAPNAWPWLNLEVDLVAANPTYFEFYKFRAVH